MPLHAPQLAWLSEAYLRADRIEDALQLAQRALEHAGINKERGHEAWALRLLGEIAAQRDPPQVEPAADYYRQAMVLAEELGMRPLAAHCHFGLGMCYRKASRAEPARTHLSTAIDLYHSMEMIFWLTQAQAEIGQTP
jgi:tetratricopeptide (TPR) repeat protein